jgi:hypothetical protein
MQKYDQKLSAKDYKLGGWEKPAWVSWAWCRDNEELKRK